jgi:hypothetical protein
VPPGLTGTCGVIDRPLKLVGKKDGKGRRAHLAGGICLGKASLVVRAANVTISGLEISNNRGRDKNGACISIDLQTSDLKIDDLYCHDNENGILGGLNKGRLVITNSLFERNGANSGEAHALHINKGDELIIKKSRILATKGRGHSLKTGARRTVVEDSVLAALEGRNSGAIDAYGGGELIVRRSVLQQGKNFDSHEIIAIAMESRRIKSDPSATILEDNWFIYDDPARCCRWLLNGQRPGPFTVRNNTMVGLTNVHMPEIERKVLNENRFFKNRAEAQLPLYDGTSGSLPEPGFKIP